MFFYLYFRRLQKAAENMGFFPRLTAQVGKKACVFARFLKRAKTQINNSPLSGAAILAKKSCLRDVTNV